MSDSSETFFTSIGCMDGRVQDPIARFGREKFGAQFPDTITEAGLVGLLSKNIDSKLLEAIKKKLLISLEKHHSKGVIVHGHEDCAGNPVTDGKHKEDVLKSQRIIRQFVPEGTEVLPVFVTKNNGEWTVESL